MRLPLRRPRRIFRPSALPAPSNRVGGTLVIGLVGAVAIGLALLTGLSSQMFGRVSPPPEHVTAGAGAVAVVDAGTLRLGSTVVRLVGIDPPARGQTCRAADGATFDCGVDAANALARLVRERDVDCRLQGSDGMGRALATCVAGGRDLNAAMAARRTEALPSGAAASR